MIGWKKLGSRVFFDDGVGDFEDKVDEKLCPESEDLKSVWRKVEAAGGP